MDFPISLTISIEYRQWWKEFLHIWSACYLTWKDPVISSAICTRSWSDPWFHLRVIDLGRHITEGGFKILLRIQSTKAIRVTRTDAHDVVLILAGMTIFRNTADAYTETNDRIRKHRSTVVELQNHGCVYEILIPEARWARKNNWTLGTETKTDKSSGLSLLEHLVLSWCSNPNFQDEYLYRVGAERHLGCQKCPIHRTTPDRNISAIWYTAQ